MNEENEIKFEDGGEIREFVTPRPTLFVAVFYYPNSDTPWGTTGHDKSQLINGMHNWFGLDRSRPVRIYTITL